jgi:hypothetical protein
MSGVKSWVNDPESSNSKTVNMDELLVALEDIREGLSEEDFAEIERAMNDEYIEAEDADHLD